MIDIRLILDSLPAESRKQLLYAFEQGFGQHVPLEGGRFIGVNLINSNHLVVESTIGVWSVGYITEPHEDHSLWAQA